jgi:hypothetical protein
MPTTSPLTARAYYSEYLAEGEDTLWVTLSVEAAATLERTGSRAEVVIIDNSGSMDAQRKMAAAKGAASAAVDAIDEGVEFAVIAGNDSASKVWPPEPRALAVAGPDERAAAHAAIARVRAGGSTSIGSWLGEAGRLFGQSSADLRHAILLSDGCDNAGPGVLPAAIDACRGVFQCDCRGFGTDWSVPELRSVAEALGGQVKLVDRLDDVGREELAEHFRALIRDSQARVAPAVRLRILTRHMSDVSDCFQSAPTKVELMEQGELVETGPRATEFPLGGWAPGEARDYTFAVKVRPAEIGHAGDRPKPAAKVELVLADGSIASSCTIKAVWTDDPVLSTRIEPIVDHYLKQRDTPEKVRAGLAAKAAGDADRAATLLGEARQDAAEAGNRELVARLDKLVYLDRTGTPRLRESSLADDMHADADSSVSSAFHPPPPRPPDED